LFQLSDNQNAGFAQSNSRGHIMRMRRGCPNQGRDGWINKTGGWPLHRICLQPGNSVDFLQQILADYHSQTTSISLTGYGVKGAGTYL